MTTLTNNPANRVGAPVLAIGFAVSLAVHVLLGLLAVVSVHVDRARPLGGELAIKTPTPPEPPEIDLGIEESSVASIAWLGVEEQEQEGEADPSTVEQAALSTNPGDAAAPTQPAQSPPPMPEVVEREPVQPSEERTEETSPAEPVSQPPPPAVEIPPSPTPETEIVDPAPPADKPEPRPEQPIEPEETPPGPALTAEPTELPTEQQPKPEAASKPTPTPAAVTTPGLPGELARREAVAAAIRDAGDVVYDRMNRPLSAHGLEIQPKAPQYPLSVRNAALPNNAIVLIRFDRNGKVRSADFLVSADGKKRYDTGQPEVDAPLIAAIYQWTAKGKQLLDLDPTDPDATIEIPMRILFSKPRYEKTGD